MIPLVGARGEFERLRRVVEAAANRVIAESGQSIPYQIGTMIEVPRAALRANRIALNCDFFSFGTNDLTQMTYGYSRDDMGTFLPVYIARASCPRTRSRAWISTAWASSSRSARDGGER
jgi:pyruvate,orthophosphate dikinase